MHCALNASHSIPTKSLPKPQSSRSSTLHQWSRDDPTFLLEERERRARGEKVVKPWYVYLLESIHTRDPYPDSKVGLCVSVYMLHA